MFLINGSPIHPKVHPDHHKWLEKKKKEVLSEGKKVYHFSGFKRKAKVKDERGRMVDIDRTRLTPVEAVFSDTEAGLYTHDTWVYVPSLSACRSDGDGRYSPTRKTIMIGYDKIFSIKSPGDLELIVFFKYMCTNKDITEVDPAKISQEKAKKEALESQVKWYIFNPNSPIHPESAGTENALRNVAMAWKVSGADSKDIYSVMNDLWKEVQQSQIKIHETHRGYEVFCEEAYKKGDVDKRKTIRLAVERNVLDYHENVWKLNLKGGGQDFLCGVPRGKEKYKDEIVTNFVVNSDDYYKEVEFALENAAPVKAVIGKKMTRDEMYAECEKLGWKKGHVITKSSEVLQDIIDNKKTPEDV